MTREFLVEMRPYDGGAVPLAREILACWDQIAEMAGDRDRARTELTKARVSDFDVAAGIRTLRRGFEVGLRAQAAWQPIETAPRDGTPILLASDEWGWILVADNRGGPRWYSCQNRDEIVGATHWMPLPPPPREAQNWARETEDDGC